MAKVGSITVEVKPTVTLESAVACVMMLNMFLEDNEEYRLAIENDGDKARWVLTDKPVMRSAEGGLHVPITNEHYPRPKYQAEIEQMNDVEIALLNAENAMRRTRKEP